MLGDATYRYAFISGLTNQIPAAQGSISNRHISLKNAVLQKEYQKILEAAKEAGEKPEFLKEAQDEISKTVELGIRFSVLQMALYHINGDEDKCQEAVAALVKRYENND